MKTTSVFCELYLQGLQLIGYTVLHEAQESFRTWRNVRTELSSPVINLNREISSLLKEVEKTKGWRTRLQSSGSHAGLPSFPWLSQIPGDKQGFSSLYCHANHCLAGIHIRWLHGWLCGLETGAYEAKVAVSLQLSFCEENLCIVYRVWTANLYQLSHKCLRGYQSEASGSLRARELLLMGNL